MTPDERNLIWIDLEMTGLNSDLDRILEIAVIVTDGELNILAEGPALPIHQPDPLLAAMDDWNRRQHGQSGLVERVRASPWDEAQAEQAVLEFLAAWVPPGKSPLCGNSICQDRRFLARWMPALEAYPHYRNLDVSSLKELVRRWAPELVPGFSKVGRHRALDDIRESIAELAYYRDRFLRLPGT